LICFSRQKKNLWFNQHLTGSTEWWWRDEWCQQGWAPQLAHWYGWVGFIQ
jgi:hypothetical protein